MFPYRPDSDFGRSGVMAIAFVGLALPLAVISEGAARWYRDAEPFCLFERNPITPKAEELKAAEPPKAEPPRFTLPDDMDIVELPLNYFNDSNAHIPSGSRVDVIVHAKVQGRARVFKLLVNSLVVNCVSDTAIGEWRPRSLCLTLTPKEASVLEVARSRGYELHLRIPSDKKRRVDSDYDLDAVVRFLDELALPVAPAPRPVSETP